MKPTDVLLAVVVMLTWGLNFPVAKFGLHAFPPLLLMTLRFALVALLLVPFKRVPRHKLPGIAVLSVLMGSLHFPLMFGALDRVDASLASIVVQMQVPFAALLAKLVYRERLGLRRLLGMAVAFAGVVVIAGAPRNASDGVPIAMILGAAFVFALANIQIKRIGPVDGLALSGWMALFATPQLALWSLLFEHGQAAAIAHAGITGWGAVVYMAVVVMMLGYGLWYPLMRRYEINVTMPFTLLVPVFGVASSVVLLGEPLTRSLLVGGTLAILGVAAIVLRRPLPAGVTKAHAEADRV